MWNKSTKQRKAAVRRAGEQARIRMGFSYKLKRVKPPRKVKAPITWG